MTPEPSGPAFLLDANVLVALTNTDHVHHGRAHEWFANVGAWATTPTTESAFVRLMLNPAVTGAPRAAPEVLSVLASVRGLPGHRFLADDTSFASPSIDLAGLQGHRQVTDLHLVAVAARHDASLATFDGRIRRTLVPADRRYCTVIG